MPAGRHTSVFGGLTAMAETSHAGPLRILIADDCHDTTSTLALLVSHWGHDVRTVDNGLAALEMAADYRPDVVLLDIGMPGLDGLELARRLRQELHMEQVLLVCVSGFGQEIDRRHALEAGCDFHLVKPVDLEELHALLSSGPRARGSLPDARRALPACELN